MFTFQEVTPKKLSASTTSKTTSHYTTYMTANIYIYIYFLLHTHAWFSFLKAGKQVVMYMHYDRLTVLYYLCPVFGPPIHSQPAKQNKRIKPSIFIQT